MLFHKLHSGMAGSLCRWARGRAMVLIPEPPHPHSTSVSIPSTHTHILAPNSPDLGLHLIICSLSTQCKHGPDTCVPTLLTMMFPFAPCNLGPESCNQYLFSSHIPQQAPTLALPDNYWLGAKVRGVPSPLRPEFCPTNTSTTCAPNSGVWSLLSPLYLPLFPPISHQQPLPVPATAHLCVSSCGA